MYLLHPIIVHFTIVLLAVAVVCDFLYLLTQKKNYWQIAGILLVIGTLSAIGAVLTGSHAYEVVDIPRSARRLVRQHRNTGTSAMWLFILTSALRFGFIQFDLFQKKIKWLYYLVALISLLFLFRTGLLGGEMAYIHGVGVEKPLPQQPQKPVFE